MSVTWTKNGDNKYLVESKEHLLQIMNKGSLYTNTGTPPTDYWASNYLQTSDIDLKDDHANIAPIGVYGTYFRGDYDGGFFKIMNWAYSGSETHAALFGYSCSNVIQRIRLAGVWTMNSTNANGNAGFLSGYFLYAEAYDIEGDFAEGTSLNGREAGCIFGRVTGGIVRGVTVRGSINVETSTAAERGGVAGYAQTGTFSCWHNYATFPNGIKGYYSGGLVGNGNVLKLSNSQNSMIGDIDGSGCAGGIVGHQTNGGVYESVVNSMTGNITSAQYVAGGIVGMVEANDSYPFTATAVLIYMRGDIAGQDGSGGIVGRIRGGPNFNASITNSIVAMQGTVDQSVRSVEDFTPSVMEVTVDTSFGMSYTGNDYGSATMVVDDALVYHSQFTDLPYIVMSGTDADGDVCDWDFVFANIGGKSEFDKYTHLSVHSAQVSAPFRTDFGLGDSNSVVYATYANVDEKSLYIDNALTISETTADVAFDLGRTSVVYGTPDPLETLSWTKNTDGKFEVATLKHMLQLMSEGSKFTDLGDHPRDYWSSAYVQTSDIDLQNDHASIAPIGNDTTQFTGEYDGGRFQIKNWSYSGNGEHTGLFGYCATASAVLKHIRLSGVWTLSGAQSSTGFLVGYLFTAPVYDVAADFDTGTAISGGAYTGVLIGRAKSCECSVITVRGTVDCEVKSSGKVGGVLGYLQDDGSKLEQCRNLAEFPRGINGHYVGGIVGAMFVVGTISNCSNAMRGDLNGYTVGGLFGYSDYPHTTLPCDSLVNSMVGNITSTGVAGGIFGAVHVIPSYSMSASKLLNYMRGDIAGSISAAGVIGRMFSVATPPGDVKITKSIVAMQGVVDQSVSGLEELTPSQIEVAVDTSFSMFFDTNDHGSATMVVDDALVYHPQFTDLPYFVLSATDPEGTSYNWDFVFSNIGGENERYTHLSVHTAKVSSPFSTDFGLAEDNDVVYLTYANTDEKSLYINSDLTISETTADIAFNYAKSAIVYGTPDPLETLAWTKNADGKFEVATLKHMLQLMSEGSKFTDLGDHPREYWSSAYVQTSDIDLQNDHASIAPIGNDTTQFTGEYDGGLFEIRNWSYTASSVQIGLFGYCSGAVIKHIRLAGVWTLLGDSDSSGFLGGYAGATTVYDVEGNFGEGTTLGDGSTCGTLIGDIASSSTIHGLTARGSVTFGVSTSGKKGGVIGYLRENSSLTQCRNLATFPQGITGANAGGILGCTSQCTLSKISNAMKGDIVGTQDAGGIIGYCDYGSVLDLVVNSMEGEVHASQFAGGMVGVAHPNDSGSISATRMLNYMRGNVLAADGAGGISGSLHRTGTTGDVSVTNTFVAMQGNVEQSVRGAETFTPSEIEVTVDTSFGMFFDMNDYGSATMVVDDAFVYDPAFTDLPYINLSGTDPDGTEYGWGFLYANIGGKYEKYTHMSVHTSSEIVVPLATTFGSIGIDNVYLTYANTDEKSLYIDPDITIVETTADVVFDHAKSVIVYGTPTPAETLTWTTDADGKFEVATKQHLLQLMNKGVLYTDLGAVRPSAYWTHHYVQTAEIDLEGDTTYFVCIGDDDTSFVGSFEHDGFEVLNWEHGDHSRLFGDRTVLEWTHDAEGRYEVSSVQHLLQIMEKGERFVDEGDFPADHWGASALYIQTTDIDLQDWHAKIHPIGNATTNFYGQYDGGGHKISNWSYTQPGDSATVSSTGLFGVVTNAEIKHLCLDGVWTLNGSAHASTYLGDGFLCGTATASTVYDVDTNFSSGTLLYGGSTTTAPVTHRVGCLIGLVSDSVVCNATVRGSVDMKDFGDEGNTYIGGVIGYVLNAGSSVTLCRNVATFPNGITGNTTGGLIGYFHMGTLSTCINAMQGDVSGITHAGGICGQQIAGSLCEVVVNSMTGNVLATDNAGGVHGCVDASSSSQVMNYMTGDVVATNAGGFTGLVTRSAETGEVSITNSIVAMHGGVNQHVVGSATFVPSALDVLENTDFGMVGSSSSAASGAELTGFTTNPAFADLPYIPLAATDPDGVLSEFDFVFSNLGGKTMYSGLFTHLCLHTFTVSAPYPTDFGLDSSNTEVYLTYANLDARQIFIDDALTIVETAADVAFNHAKSAVLLGTASLPLICEPRSLTIKANVDASGSQFRLTHQETSRGSQELLGADFTESSKIIEGLTPETTYVIRLYADDILIEHLLVTTAVNSAENYDVTDFFVHEQELYDISKIGDQVSSSIVNEIFTTGDVIAVDMNFARKTEMETTLVKKGELLDVDGLDAVLLPFSLSNTETQESTILLSNETSVTVSLEQGSGEISVGGTKYASGKSFIIDGRKCTIFDI